MGFAEIDESIGEAAARELEEEAGITGEVVTLLHADSYHSAFYGDLLIVSFEVVKTGGVERAGDDAEDVRYFPLDDLPPLAFRSNQQAIDACVGLHRDEWRIQDSFHAVQHGHDVPLLSSPAIRVIEEHSARASPRPGSTRCSPAPRPCATGTSIPRRCAIPRARPFPDSTHGCGATPPPKR